MTEPFPLLNTSVDSLHHQHQQQQPEGPGGKGGKGGGGGGAAAAAAGIKMMNRRRKSSSAATASAAAAAEMTTASSSSPPSDSTATAMTTTTTTTTTTTKRLSKRKRARGLVSRVRQAMMRTTYLLPALIILITLVGYALGPSGDSNPLRHCLFLSYRIDDPQQLPTTDGKRPNVQYGKGPADFAFVAFYTVVLSFAREFVMQEFLKRLAKRTGLSRAKQARFMEQMYTAIYFALLGPLGMLVMSRTPVWYFNTFGMYDGFPHRTHDALAKFYYLFQAAYWSQQAIVLLLGMEKPRKDFKELVGHHVVSLALIGCSYRFHFTYIGIAVYTTHDISDFFLATSKVLNYIDHPLVGPYFFLFMCVWIYMRHYINLRIILSLFTQFRSVGPFSYHWSPHMYKCAISQYVTILLLSSLQALNLFWLFHIVRIAYRFVVHNIAEDDRSDDEDEVKQSPPPSGGDSVGTNKPAAILASSTSTTSSSFSPSSTSTSSSTAKTPSTRRR
ncbi:hypothetical protein CP532_3087 [Ophiocordyceps camponoti-leonardi (nom. inval.)]|nr:hypothetical protein CP532_3087 [Ophiocordyceps camponoti-leonardi (nom. inval.)]